MVGGEYALMVKSVKYEVSCWLNVDNQNIFYFFASLIIDQDEHGQDEKKK